MSRKATFEDIIIMLKEIVDPRAEGEAMADIHEKMNREALSKLNDFITSIEPRLRTGEVLSTLCYMIALVIFQNTKTEVASCATCMDYGEYIHKTTHFLWKDHPDFHKEKSSDVEKTT